MNDTERNDILDQAAKSSLNEPGPQNPDYTAAYRITTGAARPLVDRLTTTTVANLVTDAHITDFDQLHAIAQLISPSYEAAFLTGLVFGAEIGSQVGQPHPLTHLYPDLHQPSDNEPGPAVS